MRLERINPTGPSDAVGGRQRVNPDVGADIHEDIAGADFAVDPAYRAFFLDPQRHRALRVVFALAEINRAIALVVKPDAQEQQAAQAVRRFQQDFFQPVGKPVAVGAEHESAFSPCTCSLALTDREPGKVMYLPFPPAKTSGREDRAAVARDAQALRDGRRMSAARKCGEPSPAASATFTRRIISSITGVLTPVFLASLTISPCK